ncbi:hypothetical protein [Brucella gallinifaecis]|uniref:hypothetical protein n=1 Tax=Brucella gallinifaecis TaxID=215590 RepID=UPI002360EA40|nr:hypothetical protein [Brucella gallinifaecis]
MSDQPRLKTSYDDDPLMYGFFIGCLRWALGHEEVLQRYRSETGNRYRVGKNALERMIDEATGADLAFLQSFSDWVEVNLFGTPEQVYGEGA